MIVASAFEAPTLVACLDDIAVVGQPIEQCGGHLGVAEYARPFTEGQIGGDDDGGAFIEPADEVEEELTAGLSEWQIAEFVEDDEVHAGQMIGEPALPSIAALRLKPIDEVDHVMEPATGAGADAVSGDCDGKMGFAGSSSADQHDVALLGEEGAAGEVIDERLVDWRLLEVEVIEVLRQWQLGNGELVLDRARLLLADLSLE